MKKLFLLFALLRSCGVAPAQVAVTNTTEVVNKNLFTSCAVDFGFTGNYVSRNVLADPYFSEIKGIGFCGFNFSGVSTADYSHNNGGDGYACNPVCPDQDGGRTFGKSFFNEFFSFCKKMNVPAAYIANVQTGTIDEVYKAIDSGATAVIWGGEQNLQENAEFYSGGGLTYATKINAAIDSANAYRGNITHVVDAAPTWLKTARVNSDWNNGESGINGESARMYMWADEAGVTDVATMNDFFSTKIKTWEDNFESYFPDKKIAVLQYGWKASATGINTGLNSLWLARLSIYFLSNQDKYSLASFMSLKSLDNYANNKSTLKLVGEIFKNEYLCSSVESYGNIETITTESNGKYTMLIVNTGGESQSLSITIGGKKKNVTYNGNWFTSVNSTVINTYEGISKTFDVKPYSVTVAKF